jgi:hypothetical protein
MLAVEQIRKNYKVGLELVRRYFTGDADVQRAAKHIAASMAELLAPEGLRRFKDRWLNEAQADGQSD